jgi:hypothetical protein
LEAAVPFLHLILALLMVAMPTGGRFGSVPLDEEHEKERTEETTSKELSGEHRQLRPLGIRTVAEATLAPRTEHHLGFVPTLNPRAAELALRGAAERRML